MITILVAMGVVIHLGIPSNMVPIACCHVVHVSTVKNSSRMEAEKLKLLLQKYHDITIDTLTTDRPIPSLFEKRVSANCTSILEKL